MKKILLVISVLAILTMVGCNKTEENIAPENQQQEIEEKGLNENVEETSNSLNETQVNVEGNELLSAFNKEFQFSQKSVETSMLQLAGTVTYTLEGNSITIRSLTSPEVNEEDSIDSTESITSNTDAKIIGIDNGYPRYLPEVLVKFDDGSFGIITTGDEGIKPLNVEQYMILNNLYGEYTDESNNATLTIGPSSPENNSGLMIKFEGNSNYQFTTGNENVELDTINNVILFPTSQTTDGVETIKYELDASKINVLFKDGRNVEFLPKA